MAISMSCSASFVRFGFGIDESAVVIHWRRLLQSHNRVMRGSDEGS